MIIVRSQKSKEFFAQRFYNSVATQSGWLRPQGYDAISANPSSIDISPT